MPPSETGSLGGAAAGAGRPADSGDDRSLFESVPIGLYRSTLDGRLLTANRRFVELLGYPDLATLQATSMEQLYADMEERRRWVAKLQRGGEGHAHEARLRRRDGGELWVRDTGRLVRLADGSAIIEGSLEDLTEQHRTRDALRDSETRMRAIIEHSTNMFYSHTADHVLTFVSPQSREFLGVEPDEALRRWTEFVTDHPVNAQGLASTERAIASGRAQPPYELELRRPDGLTVWVEVREAPVVEDGRTVAIVGALTDVTARHRAEAALRASEERYRRIVEDQSEFIVRWRPDLTRTFVNQAYCRYFGLDPKDALGSSFLPEVAPEDREFVRAKFARLTPDHPIETAVHRALLPDGTVAWHEWTDRAFFDDCGTLTELQSVGRDVSLRIRLEEQLRQAQKLEAIGRLGGGIAHDFNNLLQAILGSVQVVALEQDVGTEARERLAEIEELIQRGARLVRQLLLFARREAPSRRRVDLAEIVRSSHSLLRHLLRENVELHIEHAGPPLPVDVDPVQIEQVIVNLAVNASDAMPAGGRLVLRTGRNDPGHATLDVSDTGCGIGDEIRHRVFDPFFTTKDRGKGTGLGLAVVHGIVSQHGGTIELLSSPGSGCTFRVELPLAASQVPAGDVDRTAATIAPRTHGSVLLVEDDPTVRATIAELLTSAGFATRVAADVADAAERAADDGDLDLLLTDFQLPDGTGLDVARGLWERHPELPVVIVSGYAEDPDVSRLVGSGRVRFLAKPVTATAMIEAVTAALAD